MCRDGDYPPPEEGASAPQLAAADRRPLLAAPGAEGER